MHRSDRYRIQFLAYKRGKKCKYCGEKDHRCLEFHHLDPRTKSFTVGRAVGRMTANKIIEEIENKCICLCANCHAKESFEQNRLYARVK